MFTDNTLDQLRALPQEQLALELFNLSLYEPLAYQVVERLTLPASEKTERVFRKIQQIRSEPSLLVDKSTAYISGWLNVLIDDMIDATVDADQAYAL